MLARRRQHRDHAPGQPRAFGERGQRQGRQRRVLRRLEHHGAAGRQGRGALAGDHRAREVPGRDGHHHAHRLPVDQHAAVGLVRRQDLAVDAPTLLRIPAHEAGAEQDLAARLRQRLALLQRHQQRQVVGVAADQLEPGQHRVGPFLRGAGLPGRQRGRSRIHCPHRIGRAGGGHFAQHLAGGRVAHGEAAARAGGPLAADEEVRGQQRRIHQAAGNGGPLGEQGHGGLRFRTRCRGCRSRRSPPSRRRRSGPAGA
jgi:hypothetical protein